MVETKAQVVMTVATTAKIHDVPKEWEQYYAFWKETIVFMHNKVSKFECYPGHKLS